MQPLLNIEILVPSENKKDNRSIEQTMADIRAKKRQKLMDFSQDENSSQ